MQKIVNEETFINLFHEISIYLKTKPGKDITEKVSFTPTALISKNEIFYKETATPNPKYMRRLGSAEFIPTARLFNTLKAISATLHINKVKGK